MPRREKPLGSENDPLIRLAADLRALRERAGSPTYRALAERAHYSVASLAAAASGQKLPSLAVTLAYVRACGGDADQWERRWHEVARAVGGVEGPGKGEGGDAGDCPYPGLAPFQPADAERFFGRGRAVAEVRARLERHRLVALFGASGAGKSSVLRAGVMPGLPNGLLLTPGAHPLAECAARLAPLVGAAPDELRRELLAGPRGLHRVLRRTAGGVTTLVVDQFEEVFALCPDVDERELFIAALVTAARDVSGGCQVLLGVRADFYAHCTRYPELVESLRGAQVTLGPMTAEELREAITRPAVLAGCTVESALLARLVAEAAGQIGALPLLSHALRETWHHRRGMTLSLDGFRLAGGMEGALAQSAESFYAALPADRRAMTRDLFLRLTAPGEGTEDTKRRIAREELDPDPVTEEILERLAAARLLTLGDNSVEISHEALIRSWPRLHDWLGSQRDALRIHRQLTEATSAWEQLGRDPDTLYRGTRLALARDMAAVNPGALARRERAFLDASVAAEERERSAARRTTVRLRRLVVLLTVLFLIAATATVYAVRTSRDADRQRDASLSRFVASQADAMRALDPALALQLSLAGFRLAPTTQARGSVLSAFSTPYATQLTPRRHGPPLVGNIPYGRTAALSPTRPLAATAAGDGTVRLWDVRDPHRPAERRVFARHKAVVCAVAFGSGGTTLASADRAGRVLVWPVVQGDDREVIDLERPVCGLAFSPTGLLATAGEDGVVRLWDTAAPGLPGVAALAAGETARDVAFAPDGRTLAVAVGSAVRRWDTTDPRRPRPLAALTGHRGTVWSVAYSSDGRALATASGDGTARVWDLRGATPLARVLAGNRRTVYAAAFSPDGRTLATAGEDQTVQLWDVAGAAAPRRTARLTGHPTMVNALAFQRAGTALLSASQDHTVRLWDLPAPALAAHGDFVFGTAFHPDGGTLATSGQDGVVHLWDTTDPGRPRRLAALTGPDGPVYNVAFNRDGTRLATVGDDRTTRLWDVTTPARPRQLWRVRTHGDGNPEGVAFGPGPAGTTGGTLATGGSDGTIQLLDPGAPGRRPTLVGRHKDYVRAVAFAPSGTHLASASEDGTIGLWDLRPDGSRPLFLRQHTRAVRWVAFSPDGRTLASAGDDRSIRFWDVTDMTRPRYLATALGHASKVYSVAFSADGATLASSGDDRTVRLWDIGDRRHPRERATLTGHTDRLHRLAFSPDGHTVASGSRDGTALLWETDVERVARRICATAHPAVTRAQWRVFLPGVPYRPPC
ncbi:hypothetical protein ACFVIM_16520 [Streptomyces sp. NPDC057638]|uniref:nSTAND1 domain-containing NTPase n=1 Tax=Streptomyces sp. NPDC057638 TaxID=3346190 RepID=UPI0036CEE389